jgi:CheY-like chemotaxis protein
MAEKPRTVLAMLKDDSPRMREIISQALPSRRFEILWTVSLPEAIEASGRHHVDLILLDLHQPLLTGWGTYEHLATLNPDAPIVLIIEQLTAYEQAVADHLGAALRKPFGPAVLAQAVAGLATRPQADARPAARDQARRDPAANSEAFRELLHRRYTTPLESPTPYRPWGINE